MNDKQIDKLFKDKLEQLEIQPEDHIWDNIASQLDGEKTVPVKKVYWMRYAAVAATIVTLMSIVWYRFFPAPDAIIAAKEDVQLPRQEQIADTSVTQHEFPTAVPSLPSPNSLEVAKTKKAKRSVMPKKVAEVLSEEELEDIYPALNQIPLANIDAISTDSISSKLPAQRVVEIDPIQPLIDNPEEEDTMLASNRTSTGGLIPGILNKISEVINPNENKKIQFSRDEEGSLQIDIHNTLVKNRNRKKK